MTDSVIAVKVPQRLYNFETEEITIGMEALRKPGMIHVKAMCIIAHNGRILATRSHDSVKNQEFYRLVGGGVHFCERALDAVAREIAEELETGIENTKLLESVENIFTYRGNPGHEIIFIYSADLARKELYEKKEIPIADNPNSVAVWVPITDILAGTAILFPEFDHSVLKPMR